MSSNTGHSPEMGTPDTNLEQRLRRAASVFPYPATPLLAARVSQRLAQPQRRMSARTRVLARVVVLLLLVFLAAMLVSPVRARVIDWIRIGAVRIFLTQPTPTPTPLAPAGLPAPEVTITPTILKSVLDLAGETTFSTAQEQAGFDLQIPGQPVDLGMPDHVYLQELYGPTVIMVWMDADRPTQVRMSLSETYSDRVFYEKYDPRTILETQVSGSDAVWIDGDYLMTMRSGDARLTRIITQGHTLIWTVGNMTFRLETDADLETAIRIAESIQ